MPFYDTFVRSERDDKRKIDPGASYANFEQHQDRWPDFAGNGLTSGLRAYNVNEFRFFLLFVFRSANTPTAFLVRRAVLNAAVVQEETEKRPVGRLERTRPYKYSARNFFRSVRSRNFRRISRHSAFRGFFARRKFDRPRLRVPPFRIPPNPLKLVGPVWPPDRWFSNVCRTIQSTHTQTRLKVFLPTASRPLDPRLFVTRRNVRVVKNRKRLIVVRDYIYIYV